MSIEYKERLARTGDVNPEAISVRVSAARKAAGLQQNKLAAELGMKATTLNSQEKRGAPSIQLMRYFYRMHRIDFNFLLHGDFAQLPSDVQEKLFSALSAANNAQDQTAD
ncbi:MAG: helix-turn-helix domain-containing protein [Mangrovicoccus sp.]